MEPENKNVFQYIVDDDIEEKPTDKLLLTLKTSDKIDYSQFESKELERLYALIQFIQKSNRKITTLEIEDYNGESIGFLFKMCKSYNERRTAFNNENTVSGYWTYLIQTETKVGVRLNEIQMIVL